MRLALRGGQTLSLLNIATDDSGPRHSGLRHVTNLLAQWNLLPNDAMPEDLDSALGFNVVSVGIPANDARASILDFLDNHPCELAVIATRQHRGLAHWFERSVANRALRRGKTMMLMVREGGRGFVDPKTGEVKLQRILVPIDKRFDPSRALSRLEDWLAEIEAAPEIRLLYVGSDPPEVGARPNGEVYPLVARTGRVVPTILEEAQRGSADLIVLPTSHRSGVLAALRGSVSTAVLDDARWPVLSVPAT